MSFLHMKGVAVPHHKNTAGAEPVRMPPPAMVVLPMVMHIGAPAVPTVKVGDTVRVGEKVADSSGFISSPVHASVSGVVKKLDPVLLSNGNRVPAVWIESDGKMTPSRAKYAQKQFIASKEDFLRAVKDSGIVGLGGAGFPTIGKLTFPETAAPDTVIINGAECEPFITSDTRTMLDRPDEIICGLELLRDYLGVRHFIIGIEANKPDCIRYFREVKIEGADFRVKVLPPVYPQGAEKVLIHRTTGRIVPEGNLPIDVGVIVLNCTTVAALADYIQTGMPLVEKCVTVDGSAVRNPQNVIVPIGTPIRDVFAFCGGFVKEPGKILYGGPMMGIAVPDLSVPVLKNTNAILAFDREDAAVPPETACLHCGRCVNHCPMQLNPPAIAKAYEERDGAMLAKLKVNLCMECGACAFRCPARRHIVQRNRLAKGVLRTYQQQQKLQEQQNGKKEGSAK